MNWFFGHRGTLTLLSFIIKPCTLPLDQSPVELPEQREESSIEDPSILNLETVGPTELTYRIVEEGTKRRRRKLIDSLGYSYNGKEKGKYTTYWQCTVRPKGNYCRATVKETDGDFVAGQQGHNHQAEVGAFMAAQITTSVKRKAMDNLFKPAPAIVEEVI